MNKKGLPSLVVVVILGLVVIVIWIGLDVYRALNTQTPVEVPEDVTLQFDPQLNQSYLDQLPNRLYIENAGTGTTQISVEETPTPSPSASPEPSPSTSPEASPSQTPTATPI